MTGELRVGRSSNDDNPTPYYIVVLVDGQSIKVSMTPAEFALALTGQIINCDVSVTRRVQ